MVHLLMIGDNIVFEDGTISVLGSGGRLKSEDVHAFSSKELVFCSNI